MSDTSSPSLAAQLDGVAVAVQQQLSKALTALRNADLGAADRVVRDDAAINQARYDIENAVSQRLLAGALNETDLRLLLTTLHIVNDLERIGDHAEGIAKVALMLGSPAALQVPESLVELGTMVETMLADGVRTFQARDAQAARELCRHDDVIDEHYDAVYGEQLSQMAENAGDVTLRTYLLWVAHNLERIADRVTNICERTVYLVTGSVEELNVSNY